MFRGFYVYLRQKRHMTRTRDILGNFRSMDVVQERSYMTR